MTRTVMCRKYKEELPGLERPPYPGAKGQDIYDNVSKKAWDEWQSGEQTQRDMQRREEVNINHSHRRDEQDDIEIGGNF